MARTGWSPWLLSVCVFGASAVLTGCKATYYRDDADREVYRLLASKHKRILGRPMHFTIDPPPEEALAQVMRGHDPAGTAATAADLDMAAAERGKGLPEAAGLVQLTLRDVLGLATGHSRSFQREKEDLYLAILGLTGERFRWRPQWASGLDAQATDGPDADTVGAGGDLNVSQLLACGGQFTLGLATDVLRRSTGDPRHTAASILTAELIQPLWRGAGRLVARENLTQAERNAVYAVRSFARTRKSFAVDVTSRYYRVLQQRDAVTNQWSNYQRIQQSRRDTEAVAELVGERSRLEVDQARQEELRAEANWVRAVYQYREQLDQFKIFLGLPVNAPVTLDPGEVERLRGVGLRPVAISSDRATSIAVRRRLDLLTTYDQVVDAERAVALARNGLAPDAQLRLAANVPSKPDTHAARLEFPQGTYTAGLDIDLPLQRKDERNAYREALVALDRARRSADEQRDEVTFAVRQNWRALKEAERNHRIQAASVVLAERRVAGARELLRLGEATARDLLEANEALVNAQNALTRTLIDHTLARLALWRDTELLRVGEDGVWQEATDVDE